VSRQLSQQEIDAVVHKDPALKREIPAVKLDFRRPDRIPKSQIRAIYLLHDAFARNLVSGLSSYLRSFVTVNLVSVEQLSYTEFLAGLPSPTCTISLGLAPYEGHAVLELNPSLAFPIIEMLLGGAGKTTGPIHRDLTEIELRVLDGLFQIVLRGLREAWSRVTPVAFNIDSNENEPHLLHLMAPQEAVVAIGIEVRIGDTVGMMNLAMPSIVIKMMRQKFDQQWSTKAVSNMSEQLRMMQRLRAASLSLEARLEGPALKVRDLLSMNEGHLLAFDYPLDRPVDVRVNGTRRFSAQVVSTGKRRACLIEKVRPATAQGRINGDEDTGAALPGSTE